MTERDREGGQMEVLGPSRDKGLTTPGPSTPWIRRTRLLKTLSTLPDGVALVLVVAPPGYGKTTALLQWTRTTRRRVAWVRIGPEHHDRQRLVRDLARALLGLGPVEDILGELATSPSDVPPDGAAGRLASAAAAVQAPVTIVLDDLHLLRSRAALDLVVALAVRLPPGCQVVAMADRQPHLQVARLRSEGRCLDVRADDLAFSRDETTALLRASDAQVDADTISDLQGRTEGWPAG